MPRQRDGADEDHEGDEGAGGRVRVEPLLVAGLPDNYRGDDDPDVVDGVADHVHQHPEHAQVAAGLLELGRVVAVLRMRLDGLGGLGSGVKPPLPWSAACWLAGSVLGNREVLTLPSLVSTGPMFTSSAWPWSWDCW